MPDTSCTMGSHVSRCHSIRLEGAALRRTAAKSSGPSASRAIDQRGYPPARTAKAARLRRQTRRPLRASSGIYVLYAVYTAGGEGTIGSKGTRRSGLYRNAARGALRFAHYCSRQPRNSSRLSGAAGKSRLPTTTAGRDFRFRPIASPSMLPTCVGEIATQRLTGAGSSRLHGCVATWRARSK